MPLDMDGIHLISLLLMVTMSSTSASDQLQSDGGEYLNPAKNPNVFGISRANCSDYLPQGVLTAMEQYSQSHRQQAKSLLIPDDYLVACLLNVSYTPFWRALGYSDPLRLQLSFALEQLLRLDQDGTLSLKATLEMDWNEPHLQWDNVAVPPSIAPQCAYCT